MADSYSVGLLCSSNRLPGEADVAGASQTIPRGLVENSVPQVSKL